MLGLKDKVVIVTGSGRGIGKSVALKFAQMGAKIVISDINENDVNQSVADMKAQGVEAIGIKANVSVSADCEALLEKAKETFGKVDVLINNAGITRDNLIIRMTEDEWDAVIAVNLKGVFNCSKAAVKIMMKQKFGSIINIASVVGIMGNPGQANYSASKGGVIAFTKTLAKEYAGRNVRVNAIAPGFIDTAMTQAIPENEKKAMISMIPLKRLGLPDDIANAAAFLASDLATYITGQVLVVDGGMVM
ncbi:MAG TPA: beta-ketoacyl-ACP reductase [Spirochaetia bacterium]|nr:MAG: 3-oxoacyl-[acyl-carrier-protein] reductase [Spirochaetes bacterium GWB1_36_13]HCL57828.1 beta-ketoacyl-ACP reductase [Spirochaetia bacterium]